MNVNISIRKTVKLIIGKLIIFLFSVWSYIPIIVGILSPMLIILPIAYVSWEIPSLLLGGLLLETYITISQTTPVGLSQYIFICIFEIIIFIGGIILFVVGLIHLIKGKKRKELIVRNGIYRYIRHPQNLGISILTLPFSLYIPAFNDLGIRIGEIFSWLFFVFILSIYSNLEEFYLLKRFPEEFAKYQLQTGFYLPILFLRRKNSANMRRLFLTPKKRFIFLFFGYLTLVLIVYFTIQILIQFNIVDTVIYF